MNLLERYRRLTFWNKLAAWGSVVGILSFPSVVIPFVRGVYETVAVPISFEDTERRVDSYIYPGARNDSSLDWIRKHVPGIPTTPFQSFRVVSNASKYHVQLAPYLVINVLAVEPLPDSVVSNYRGERGDGGGIIYFGASLTPTVGLVGAPHTNFEEGYPPYDYYDLAPGEAEEMMLSYAFVPGYIYTYRIGVQYRYRNENAVHWLPGRFTVGVPEGVTLVRYFDDAEIRRELHPDHSGGEAVRNARSADDLFMARHRLFTLDQIR